MPRRVLITGLGTVSALGMGAGGGAFWEGLCAGRTALGPVRRFDASGFRCGLAGEVADLSIRDLVPKHYRKATKVMARDTEIAVAAAKFAVQDAGLVTRSDIEEGIATALTHPAERTGCHIGAGLIAADSEEMAAAMATARGEGNRLDLRAWGGEGGAGMESLTPLWLLKYLPNMLACHVTIIHGAEGPSNTITCAEASGLLSVGESARVVERGAADICFSGSAESKVNPMGMLRMDLCGYLAQSMGQTDGSALVRPFDPQATGTVLGEGGGILMLEEREAAIKRGARAYAEVVGFGGGHSEPGYPAGENDEGYRYAIENALEDAGIGPEAISAVVPLGSGVPALDRAELGALRAVLGERLGRVPLITLTPNLGLSMAGCGGLQVAAGALALHTQTVPARVHRGRAAGDAGAGPADRQAAALEFVLVCSGSLGAQNAAVVLKAVR